MSFKAIFKKIYQTKPFRTIESELNRKIDNKLNKFIQPLTSVTEELHHSIIETKNVLDGRHLEELRLLHLSFHEYKQIISNQESSFYQCFHSYIYPAFSKAISKIAGDEFAEICRYDSLLLLEIMQGYTFQGGIWQLNDEVARFNHPPLPTRPIESTSNTLHPKNRLKVLIVTGMFPSIEHGGGLRLFDIISQLAENHDVDLFSVYNSDLDLHSLDLLSNKLGQVKLVDVAAMTPDSIKKWLSSLGRLPGHYHVIQCEYPHSVPLIESLRSFGGKIGFTFMECMTKSFLIKMRNAIHEKDFANLGLFIKWFWKISAAEMQAMTSADFTIAVTPEDADFLERVTGRRPEVIPTCLSPSEVINKVQAGKHIKPEDNTVVFLGYFGHFPNIDSGKWYLTHVHHEVKRHVPDYRFLVVGAGDTSELQKISSNDPSVEYTGRVDDIVPYIMRGKVCILPLISGAGIRGKLNQYSIAGRSSVSTTIGNLGLNYEDGKSVLVADEPENFAAAIITLLNDDALNQKIAAQAQAYAEGNFTWERHISRLLEIYRA